MIGDALRQLHRAAAAAVLLTALLAFAGRATAAAPGGELGPAGEPSDPATRIAQAPAAQATSLENEPIKRTRPAAAPAAPATQKTTARPSAGGAGGLDAKRVVTALAVVVILILLVRVVGKRFFGVTGVKRTTRAVQIMSRSPYSPRHEIVTVRVGRRLLVLADGGGQVNTLSEITDPDEVAAFVGQLQDDHADRATPTFGNLFGKHRRKYDDDEADPETVEAGAEADATHGAIAGRLGARGHEAARYDEPDDQDPDSPAVTSTRQELSGLMDKVRLLSRQYKS